MTAKNQSNHYNYVYFVVNQTYLTESRTTQLENTTVLTKLIWLF